MRPLWLIGMPLPVITLILLFFLQDDQALKDCRTLGGALQGTRATP